MLEAKALQPPVQRAPAQAQSARCVTYVASVASQSFLDEELFDLFQTHLFQARRAHRSGPQCQIASFDAITLCHQHRALDDVVQLADIALPGMLEHRLRRIVIETGDVLTIAPSMHAQEMVRQWANVFAALAQGRQMNLYGVEAEKQI